MIDLHCHLLPEIDDGAPDLATSLQMAKMAVADGIQMTACTPHIYPGLYENQGPAILQAIAQLRQALEDADIPLQLTHWADAHLAPDLLSGLRNRRVPSLNSSRYFLFEPPHHVAPPRLEETIFSLLSGGYVPVITHPERLTWVADHYPLFKRLVQMGAWIQLTSGSLTGRFGRSAHSWGERFVKDGLVHILATDAHSLRSRPPLLAEGRDQVAKWLGSQEAHHMVVTRPQGILDNQLPSQLPELPENTTRHWWKRFSWG